MPGKRHDTLFATLITTAWTGIAAGLITTLLEYRLKKGLKFGLVLGVLGVAFLVFAFLARKRQLGIPSIGQPVDGPTSRSTLPPAEDTLSPSSGDRLPPPVSFVAPVQESSRKSTSASGSIRASESDTIRFVVYRLELGSTGIRAIFANHSVQDLEWSQINAVVIRQLPLSAPWDGKLLLDLIPSVPSGGIPRPLRLLSSTYVNYAALPQGQSASSRENLKRLGRYLVAQNPSIFVEASSAAFFNGGTPPVRFQSMAHFGEYDSQYA